MSWQEYVDDHLMCELPNGGNLKSAAIVGLDGGVWAQSPEFPTLSNDEVRDGTVPIYCTIDEGGFTLCRKVYHCRSHDAPFPRSWSAHFKASTGRKSEDQKVKNNIV